MNNDHNNQYYNNYYRDYISYLYSTNNIIQQNINFLQNNCYNLYHLNRYFLNNQYYLPEQYNNTEYSNHNNSQQYNNPIEYNTNLPNNTTLPNNINIPNSNEISNQNSNEISNNNFQDIFRQVFHEIRLMENENIYNYILDNCITYNKFYEIENPMNEECPINQTEFDEYDDVIMINNCNHIFNPDAIKHWFKSNHTCPLCRSNLIENTDYEPQSSYQFRF